MTEEEQADANAAAQRGVQIYLHDRAAWLATDEARKLKAFRDEKRGDGYVTERRGNEIRVTFFGAGTKDSPLALYRVIVPDSAAAQPAEALENPEPLSGYEAGAVAARKLAMRQKVELCGKTYNSVVLPAPAGSDARWIVYLLPGTTERNVIPMGGAWRMEVNAAVDTVLSQRTYTRSCFQMPDDPKAEALVLTHLMDPVPTELHVFWSLTARKMIMVLMTQNESVWAVSRGSVGLVERGSFSN
ncbi:MAG: hypothetical protein ABIQ86_08600 [Steroidobacteraceae bacterium]